MIWNVLICSLALTDFKAANALYDAGKFAEAAAAYERVEPKTASVYFNLGNAFFRQDKVGLAVLNYERARRLAPRDPDILANLKFAEQRLGVDELNTPSTPYRRFLRSAVASRTTGEWSRYELVTMWITILALAGIVWLPRARTGMILVTAVAGTATLATAGVLVPPETAAPAAGGFDGKRGARRSPAGER